MATIELNITYSYHCSECGVVVDSDDHCHAHPSARIDTIVSRTLVDARISPAPGEITALDLFEESERAPGGEVSRWHVGDHAQAADVLWYPEAKRAGVAWGAHATWTDAESARDAVERVCVTGEVES